MPAEPERDPETQDRVAADAQLPAPQGSPRADLRWLLFRDALVLQAKLILEGLKDLALGPVALVAAALDLTHGDEKRRGRFYRILRLGRRFERWLNLYGALLPEEEESELADDAGIDRYFRRIERSIAQELERGGLTAQAKQRVDVWLDKLEKTTRR